MKKREKTTSIFFNEADANTTICTYNTKLKNRLAEFAEECPELCRLITSDEEGYMEFEINKDNFITVEAHLVGSGAKNLETQNANKPIDLDYNLCILDWR